MNRSLKAILSLFLLAALLSSLPLPVLAQEAPEPETEETGAPEVRALTISSEEEFLTFAENCRLDAYSENLSVRLTRDLNLKDLEFAGIPIFLGTFDGGRHKIKNLDLNASGSNLGLFRYLTETALVKNLTVQGTVKPQGSLLNIGGIVGNNAGTVENCRFEGTLEGGDLAGGIAGINQMTGRIENCQVTGSLSANHFLGGIAGENRGVIVGCVNRASVNTSARENTVNVASISMETITGTEAANTVTDIGGITGTNIGVIRDCTNKGNVGYRHMGYNVGGITGSHNGYMTGCHNYGDIYGRKEVGGIAGQFEPISQIEFQIDTLQILEGQLSSAASALNRASYNAQSNLGSVGIAIEDMREDAKDAKKALKKMKPENWTDPDAMTAARNNLRGSLQSMRTTMSDIGDAAGATIGQLNQDLKAVSAQMNAMSQTIKDADENLGVRLSDISDADTEDLVDGKIADCKNYGPINGDLNAGGIVGAIALENDLDPEDDLKIYGDKSLNFDGNLRAVVLRCENQAPVTVKKTCGGGIAGLMTLGLAKDSVNTGIIDGEKAQYLGGIAGSSRGYIRSCYVKCGLKGESYVGGIAGSGTVVTDCLSMVTIRLATEKQGAILGIREQPQEEEPEDPILGNLYMSLSRDLGAIDGVSYKGLAEPVTPLEFQKLEDLPETLKKTTLIFRDEHGSTVERMELPMGGIFREKTVPEVPEKEGYTGVWQDIELYSDKRIYFDGIFTPVYTPYRMTIASTQVRSGGRPVLLAEGAFRDLTHLSIQKLDPPALPDRDILESWTLPALTGSTVLHYHQPDGAEAGSLRILLKKEDGTWEETPASVNARYLVFTAGPGTTAFSAEQIPDHSGNIYVLCGAGAIALLVIIYKVRKKKKNA